MSEKQQVEATDPYGGTGDVQALQQAAALLGKRFPALDVRVEPDGKSFRSHASAPGDAGILAATGEIGEDGNISMRLEVVRAPREARIAVSTLFEAVASVGGKSRWTQPESASPGGDRSLWVELPIHASPMTIRRETAFLSEIDRIDGIARSIQADLPASASSADLVKLYADVSEYVEPVFPLDWKGPEADAPLGEWSRQTLDFIDGGMCVALAGSPAAVEQFAAACLARAGKDCGRTFARLVMPAIASKGLLELTKKVPGTVIVPAPRLSLGSNPYEMTNEVQAMLAVLIAARAPVVFTGSFEQLQGVFSGGQGGTNDALHPVLRRVPDVDLKTLARFAVESCGRKSGGLPAAAADDLVEEVMGALEPHGPSTRKRLLPTVAVKAVGARVGGKKRTTTSAYAEAAAGVSETLAGLAAKPRAERSSEVQDHYVSVLSSPGLLAFLEDNLLAQHVALEQLATRLKTECLTRPGHQPLRYCAQGTPGTGKSESAILIAQRLGIPYINIDAASMPDHYTATAQLLGSGRGIVGSYQSGRLEQAAKHHRGALIELSDLDHANPAVRSTLSDILLQALETGEGQSATGAMFSCANLIFSFTMNLPDGMDETIRRSLGFRTGPSRRDLDENISAEIKRVLSGAFLSRVGKPILFEPLDGPALAAIIERAIRSAVSSAAQRLGMKATGIVLEDGLGARLVGTADWSVASSGARALLEQGRTLAAEAIVDFRSAHPDATGGVLTVSFDPPGKLAIHAL